ncbi:MULTISPECIES: hypothetical protein [unclassified Endozoicomonas]|uniref:hypothetical protein n=1 Tax=unclassified Endozoicomonas TaxID=2644528 RepID=UPI002149549B|nr:MULTISPECIES: hypothetical protein [unclassified Endozoicomonas]
MCIVRLVACAFLTLVIFFSEAWAGNTQIESYSALKSALGQGKVPVNGLIDMEQCQYKWPLSLNSRGKKMIVFKQNTINEDGSIVM